MGKRNGSYNADFPAGTRVRIVQYPELEKFMRDWRFHHPLQHEQLALAGQLATIASVGYYHGGDELYKLVEYPGTWHEACIELAAAEDGAA
jgi:hypothetical protein